MKLLTVSVAAYNVEAYLDKCLGSFADDRLAEGLEVLVIDDGSTDRTAAIAKEWQERYPAIFRLISKENGGHGSTVNRGMAEAQGKYFRVVDGDDWVDTDALVSLLKELEETDTDMVLDQRTFVDMQTGRETRNPYPGGTPLSRPVPFLEYAEGRYADFYNLHTLSVRTELLREWQIRLQEGIFYVDYEYVLKTTARCRTVTFLPLFVYYYLVGNSAQSVDPANYVRRISHHRQMTEEVLRWTEESGFTGRLGDYVDRRVRLLIYTHYNIALIYDKDRRRGAARGKEFRKYLKKNYPRFAKATARRYWEAKALHLLGVDFDKLEKMRGRR